MGNVLFESHDIEEIAEFLGQAYARMELGSRVERPLARIERHGTDLIGLDRLTFEFEMEYAVAPMDMIALATIDSGTIPDYVTEDVRDSFGPGDVVVLNQPGRPVAGRLDNLTYTITTIDPAILAGVAGPNVDHEHEPVRLLGHRPVSSLAARHLRRTIDFIRASVVADTAVSAQPLVVDSVTRLLAASVLNAFPHTASGDPIAKDSQDANPATLRRAIAFIEENAHQVIGAVDIATAAGVTSRAVQLAFRRHLNTTPTAYLRRVRLALAHQDLLVADPTRDTVTRIATHWGFLHLGRFAATYRATYGRPPGETLRD